MTGVHGILVCKLPVRHGRGCGCRAKARPLLSKASEELKALYQQLSSECSVGSESLVRAGQQSYSKGNLHHHAGINHPARSCLLHHPKAPSPRWVSITPGWATGSIPAWPSLHRGSEGLTLPAPRSGLLRSISHIQPKMWVSGTPDTDAWCPHERLLCSRALLVLLTQRSEGLFPVEFNYFTAGFPLATLVQL